MVRDVRCPLIDQRHKFIFTTSRQPFKRTLPVAPGSASKETQEGLSTLRENRFTATEKMMRKNSTASSSKTFSPNSSKAASDYAVKKTRRGTCALRHPRLGSEKARGAGKKRPYGCKKNIKGSLDSDGPKDLPIKSSAAHRKHDSGDRKKKPRIDLPRNFDSTTAASEHGVSLTVGGDVVKSMTGHHGNTNQTQPSILLECPFKMKYEESVTSREWAVESQTDSKWEDLPVLKSYTHFIGETHMMTIEPGVYVLVNHSSISYGKDLTLEDEKKL